VSSSVELTVVGGDGEEEERRGSGGAGRRRPRGVGQYEAGAAPVRGRITEEDRRLLGWMGRHRFVTVAQLSRRFGRSGDMIRRRLRVLRGWGLAERVGPAIDGYDPAYRITAAGLALVESRLRTPRVSPATWVHEAALVDLAICLEARGLEVVTERELRAAEYGKDPKTGQPRARWSLVFPTPTRDGDGRHYPDLVVPGEACAYEVELSRKELPRLERIVAAYRGARGRYRKVVYLVGSDSLRRRIEAVVSDGEGRQRALAELTGVAAGGVEITVQRFDRVVV